MTVKKWQRKAYAVGISAVLAASLSIPALAAQPADDTGVQTETPVNADDATDEASGPVTEEKDAMVLDYATGIEKGIYKWNLSENGKYYSFDSLDEDGNRLTIEIVQPRGKSEVGIGALTSTKITNLQSQQMRIFVPAAYLNEDGSINQEAEVNGYTAATAPIIFEGNNGGWRSGVPSDNCKEQYIDQGFIYVSCGSRSRDAKDESDQFWTGKAPIMVVDLKAGVMALRANTGVIPGDKDRIISVGTSGAGQMSSILGASGDMPDYYPYLYDIGAVGVEKDGDSYSSEYADSVYAAQCYCPIADLENADLAYAWMRYDAGDTGAKAMGASEATTFTDFDLQLQEDEANAFVDYINSLNLKDADGNALTLESPREGSYYDAVLENMSDALNAFAKNSTFPLEVKKGMGPSATTVTYNTLEEFFDQYGDTSDWLTKDEDGTYHVTDMAGFINGTNLVRNKLIPGFDQMDGGAENDAFGQNTEYQVHYCAAVGQLLKDNYEEYSKLDGFNKEYVDKFIADTVDNKEEAALINYQTNLMNATEILLGNNDLEAVHPAKYFRTRNGTADEHTSFSIAYNLCLAAESADLDADYSLVWNMGHGDEEGTTTGTFIDWVKEIAPAEEAQSGPVVNQLDAAEYLDYAQGIADDVYGWNLSEDGKYYSLNSLDENGDPIRTEVAGMMGRTKTVSLGVYTSTQITNPYNQSMMIYVPAAYLNEDGTINETAVVNGYTAKTAPIVFENQNGAWKSGTPGDCDESYIDKGFIYISCGSRSRDAKDESDNYWTGKAPTMVVDLKAGVIQLRANDDVIPGDKDRIISVGTSGAGQMSTILGASGDMPEYFPYLYATGATGVTKNEDGTYTSEYADNVYAAQCYCPIADLENADLAYAWMRYNTGETSVNSMGGGTTEFTEFDLALQEDEANAFVDYINGLNLKDTDGNALTLENPRKGSYYDAVLQNMTDAFNAFAENTEFPMTIKPRQGDPVTYNSLDEYLQKYKSTEDWLKKNADGTYQVTDLDEFIKGTNFKRNKLIPGFDTMAATEEGDAFGKETEGEVHFSASVAKILQENYDKYSKLDGFNKEYVDKYISDTITNTEEAELIDYQTNLMNATEIMLGSDGLKAVHPAEYFRTRNGTADEHTSFTIAYNVCLAALAAGSEIDYSLVWDMGHGHEEGTTTGTFVEWIEKIAPAEAVKTGWQQEDGIWYYYDADGKMVTNAWAKDSKGWCYLGADGKMVTKTWAKDSKGWCYLGDDGRMVTNGWAKDSKGWCYLGADGYCVKAKWISDKGEWYYIKANGYMAAKEWAKDSKGWMYMDANGKITKNKWIQSGGQWYYLKANGYMAANEWAKDSSGWMYMDANGKITKNKWIKSGSAWYYLKSDGYMATGSQTINGKTYTFDSSGKWIS